MQQISNERKQEIIKALEERGVRLPCPRCGNQSFTLLDGYFNQTVQTDLKGMVLGGPSVPSVVLACNRCGYLSQHALGSLGLLPRKEAEK
jgi:ribosomal protein L37E